MRSNILKKVPKPILEKAQSLIQNALAGKEIEAVNTGSPQQKTSYTETFYVECLTLSEIIKWGKDNFPTEQGISLAVTKDNSTKRSYPIKISLAFVNENQEVMICNVKSAIYCKSLDLALQETFGDEDIIILQ